MRSADLLMHYLSIQVCLLLSAFRLTSGLTLTFTEFTVDRLDRSPLDMEVSQSFLGGSPDGRSRIETSLGGLSNRGQS